MSLTDEVLICPQCREALTYGSGYGDGVCFSYHYCHECDEFIRWENGSDNPDLLQQMIREQLKIRVGDQGEK